MKALGINIFAGGFTMGVEAAGFEVVGQWEECGAGSRTFDLNFGQRIPRPLRYEDWPLLDAPRLDLVYANPPCAPWSAANTRQGRNILDRISDPRLAMTARSMETAMALRPRAFVLESVARAYSQGRAYYDTWAEKWIAAGYGVTYYVTDALLCGAPSVRERFHFIAHQGDLRIADPPRDLIPRTTRAAIADIADRFGHLPHHVPRRERPEVHETMRRCEPGRQLNEVEDGACAKWSFLYRRSLYDAPAYTLIGVEMQVHPERPRLITAREGLRLCGYPDDFKVHLAEMTKAPTQSVLPPVARHVAMIIKNMSGRAQRELEVVDHRDFAKPYRPAAVRAALEEEL